MDIICFLWGDWCHPYGEEYVYRLRDSVEKHLSIPHRFICLTDRDLDVDTIRIEPKYKWNHNKLIMFSDIGLKGRVIALDLDCIIQGSLDDFAQYNGPMAVCESFGQKGLAGGSMIGFEANTLNLFDRFLANREKWEQITHGSERLFYRMAAKTDFWQRMYPGTIASYKRDNPETKKNARIVFYHGEPRPHTHW